MRHTTLLILLLILLHPALCVTANAQTSTVSISGSVKDLSGNPLYPADIYLKVILGNGQDSIVAYTSSDKEGFYRIEADPGEYVLGASLLGYTNEERTVTVTANEGLHEDFSLEENTMAIQEVVVQGHAVRVRNTLKGFTVDVSDIKGSRNNALDLLSGLPNIMLVNEKLSVIGKQKIVLKVGNVVQRIDASDIETVLKGYDANMVEEVEVLMQPPVRYDPDGNAAMIVLNMVSEFRDYVGGNIGTEQMPGLNGNNRFGGYGSVVYNKGKLSVVVNPSYNYQTSGYDESQEYRMQGLARDINSDLAGKAHNVYGRIAAQYDYSKKGNVGISATYKYNRNSSDIGSVSLYRVEEGKAADSTLNGKFSTNSDVHTFNVSAYWEQQLADNGSQLWLDASYYGSREDNIQDFNSQMVYASTGQTVDGYTRYFDDDGIVSDGATLKLDFYLPALKDNKLVFETGVTDMWNRTANQRYHDEYTVQSNTFTYMENILQPYLSGNFTVSDKFWGRVGIQVPVTWTRTHERTSGETGSDVYVHYLPSLHLAYKPSQKHSLTLTANSYVNRPKFYEINPFTWTTSQNMFQLGNPALSPSAYYDISAGWSFAGLSLMLNAQYGLDLVSQVTAIEGETIYVRPENAQNSSYYGATASYYFNKLPWMTLSLSANYGYKKYVALIPGILEESDGSSYGANMYLGFVLDKKRTISAYVNGVFIGREYQAAATVDPQYSLGAGFNWSLLNRRLNLGLSCLNILASNYSGVMYSGQDRIRFDNRYNFPQFYISVSYRFGKVAEKRAYQRSVGEEMRSRLE